MQTIGNQPKIKLVPLWPDREKQRLKQYEKILSQEVIEGDLDLRGSSIENLGNIKHVKGDLNLDYCKNLKFLPEGLIVEGFLGLMDTNLKELPKGLQIGNFLNIQYCVNLQSLPTDLKVGCMLHIVGCQESVIDQVCQKFNISF